MFWNGRICFTCWDTFSHGRCQKILFQEMKIVQHRHKYLWHKFVIKIVQIVCKYGQSLGLERITWQWRCWWIVGSLTWHLMNKANVLGHGGDHVVQRVLLHLDGGVGHEDQRVNCCSIRGQHVVYLWVHPWTFYIIITTHLWYTSDSFSKLHNSQYMPLTVVKFAKRIFDKAYNVIFGKLDTFKIKDISNLYLLFS